jgi:hypothetical protein
MSQEVFEVGVRVKHKENGTTGVVVPILMDLCVPGYVMVDFDGVHGTHSCPTSILEVLGMIQVEFDSERCRGCVFANGSRCHRYLRSRFGWMLASNGKGYIPNNGYPFCKDETC